MTTEEFSVKLDQIFSYMKKILVEKNSLMVEQAFREKETIIN